MHIGDLTGTDVKTAMSNLAAFDGTADGAADLVTVDGTNAKFSAGDPGHAVLTGTSPKVDVSGGEPIDDFLVAGAGTRHHRPERRLRRRGRQRQRHAALQRLGRR